ncbi:LysM repeat-containing protein [Caminicella sporogenes DSM 14501]|uniref:LysM repeat-containing protein n=1 Tax=Caminicella sporogenes DSM 14501 TaxID=1121266 RepID=A0A1M6QHL8_9FIRM|nr:LysM peptidoglycan-binding domain-containing protein [Caminicella sporogenes]RKD25310.1 hypothetical protein BET04_03615 [Caminicella sporogenes]SHK19655.1 LysM repeat-containing protein [Caminicella sporogenes DSM 14501]
MNLKKIIVGGLIGFTILSQSSILSSAETVSYKIKSGDTYWKISQKYNLNYQELLDINSSYQKPYLDVGDTILLPYNSSQKRLYKVKWGDTYWKISKYFNVDFNLLLKINGADKYSQLNIGDVVIVPNDNNIEKKPYITYTYYTVQKNDDLWKIAIKFGISYYELLKENNMNENSTVYVGDVLKIPVHHIPVKQTPGQQYGEYLDWWTEAQYVVPIGKIFKVRDFYTGKEWTMKRTIGANHADCEPLTKYDSEIIKKVWGGSYSWITRPVLILVDGRKIAASAASMPHSIQYITDNNFIGHMDIHFANSTRHKDGKVDYDHQKNIKIAAGL